MSDADATEPVKALREWCGLPETYRANPLVWLNSDLYVEEVDAAIRLLSAAPALLARIEAGEGLLRESRPLVFQSRMTGAENGGPLYQKIAAFLAGKEANRG